MPIYKQIDQLLFDFGTSALGYCTYYFLPKFLPIILAQFLILLVAYYSQNYASIICQGLFLMHIKLMTISKHRLLRYLTRIRDFLLPLDVQGWYMSSWSSAGQFNIQMLPSSKMIANTKIIVNHVFRDPIAGSRPMFREIVIVLTGSPQDVLSIPREALDVHRLAGVLGSPLEVAKNMYSDLQNKYCSDNIYDWTESLVNKHRVLYRSFCVIFLQSCPVSQNIQFFLIIIFTSYI